MKHTTPTATLQQEHSVQVQQLACLPRQDDCRTNDKTLRTALQTMHKTENPTNNATNNKQRFNNNRTTSLKRAAVEVY